MPAPFIIYLLKNPAGVHVLGKAYRASLKPWLVCCFFSRINSELLNSVTDRVTVRKSECQELVRLGLGRRRVDPGEYTTRRREGAK